MNFATDRSSGSSSVARGFLGELERWIGVDVSSSAAEFRAALLDWLRAAQSAQPTMGLVHQLAARALEVAGASANRGDSPAEARRTLAQSCAAEREDLAAQQRALARTAVGLLTEREGFVATLSASGAVRDALILAHAEGLAPRVLVSESRPHLEGRDLAAAVAQAGIPTWIVVDAALPLLVSGARMVWLGADAVTDRGVVNKIGSYAVALAAREQSVPVYVLAARRKFLPATTRALKIMEMPPDEVWPDPSSGVRPRNVYFELIPFELIRGIVVEDAVLGGSEARTVALDRPIPEELTRP